MPPGVAPKPPSKRRRTNTPVNYGLAQPVKGGKAGHQPPIGFPAHDMVVDMWEALGNSVEGRFYSEADWQRARVEMLFMHKLIAGEVPWSASNMAQLHDGLGALLVSPADKRRAGIELQAAGGDADEEAAELQMARYQDKLAG